MATSSLREAAEDFRQAHINLDAAESGLRSAEAARDRAKERVEAARTPLHKAVGRNTKSLVVATKSPKAVVVVSWTPSDDPGMPGTTRIELAKVEGA